MNLEVQSQPGGWKSFPAELRSWFPGNGAERLMHSSDAVRGLGAARAARPRPRVTPQRQRQNIYGTSLPYILRPDPRTPEVEISGPPFAPVTLGPNLPSVGSPISLPNLEEIPGAPGLCIDRNTGNVISCPYGVPATAVGMSGLGITAQEWADIIKSSSEATLPFLVAQTPGVVYQQAPDGRILVYAQPTGSTQNLPVGAGMPAATVTTPIGSGSITGDMDDMMPWLVVGGLALLVLFAGRK